MDCESIRTVLDDHVDGLLPPHLAGRIRNHLDLCEHCRAQAIAARAASCSLSAWDDLEPPRDGLDRILERIEGLADDGGGTARGGRLLRATRRFAVPGGLAAAAAVVGGLGLVGLGDAPAGPVPARPATRAADTLAVHYPILRAEHAVYRVRRGRIGDGLLRRPADEAGAPAPLPVAIPASWSPGSDAPWELPR